MQPIKDPLSPMCASCVSLSIGFLGFNSLLNVELSDSSCLVLVWKFWPSSIRHVELFLASGLGYTEVIIFPIPVMLNYAKEEPSLYYL